MAMRGYIGVMRRSFRGLALAVLLSLSCTGSERVIFSELGPNGVVVAPAGGDGGASPMGVESGVGSAASGVLPERLRADASFDWPQSLPGAGMCAPGTYTGRFDCMLGFFPLSGSLTFTLDRADEAEVLEIVTGEVVGLDAGGIELLRGELAGTLRCGDRTFDAQSVNGRSLPTLPLIPIPAFDAFDASFDGDFDPDLLQITGNWQMSNTGGLLCDGPFTASRSP